MKNARQFDFTPTIAGDFCQHRSSSTHNCCTTCMTRTTISTAQLLIFLLGLLAAFVAQATILVSASSCNQGVKEGISQAGHTKSELLLPLNAGFSLEYCHTLPVQHLISICGYIFLVGIFDVQEHSSWKDNEIVYCHLLIRNLASFSVRQLLDGSTRRWMSSPWFVDACKLSA